MAQTPKLVSRDTTRPEFWDERFVAGLTPWDQGGVSDDLRRYFATLVPDFGKQCLIPGCGNAYELAYLAEAGWDVVAIDFAPAAVSSAQLAHPRFAERIVLADFFSYAPARPLQCIVERAFLCALPPSMRSLVVARWAELLPAGALLLGYFFVLDSVADSALESAGATDKISGPPFGITGRQLTALLSPYFECIEDIPVADSIAVFENRERWQVWRKI